MHYKIPRLPNLILPDPGELETKSILKKITTAHKALAELKGVAAIIPN